MNTLAAYALLGAMAAVLLAPAHAQLDSPADSPVMIWTDSDAYDHDSMVMVSGKVANMRTGVPISLTVLSPSGNIVSINQIPVNSDGTFEATISTGGNLLKYDGDYTIRAQYGDKSVYNTAMFALQDGIAPTDRMTPGMPAASCRASEIPVWDRCVPYTISGGRVVDTMVSFEQPTPTLTVMISTQTGGELVLMPDADIIQGVEAGTILVDGDQWDDAVIDGSTYTIPFPPGTERIEVVATFIVPEFGTVAVMILAVAIISIVAITARSRLSIIPRI